MKDTCKLRPYEGQSKMFCPFRSSHNIKEDYSHYCFPGRVHIGSIFTVKIKTRHSNFESNFRTLNYFEASHILIF